MLKIKRDEGRREGDVVALLTYYSNYSGLYPFLPPLCIIYLEGVLKRALSYGIMYKVRKKALWNVDLIFRQKLIGVNQAWLSSLVFELWSNIQYSVFWKTFLNVLVRKTLKTLKILFRLECLRKCYDAQQINKLDFETSGFLLFHWRWCSSFDVEIC